MENVRQIWQETAKKLVKLYERREAESISYLLFEDILGISKASILAEKEIPMDGNALQEAIERLLEGQPLQYVTGIADFYGRQFRLSPAALIPRPETEELCALIIRENEISNPSVLDVGTGSGCIAITLALETGSRVTGSDFSNEALDIARQNNALLAAQVDFFHHNVLNEELPVNELDILVSNPPYIPEREKVGMNRNVVEHEPKNALFVPDEDPLLFYRALAEKGKAALKSGGKIYFEIHENFGKEIVNQLTESGYQQIEVFQDMQGKDRMVRAIL